MRRGLPTPDDILDKIILLYRKGLKTTQIVGILNVSDSVINNAVSIYENISNDNPLHRRMREKMHMVEWACKRLGKSVDDVRFIEEKEPASESSADSQTEIKVDNTALAFAALLDSIKALTAEVAAINTRLSDIQLTQQGFRSDCSEKAKAIVEAINVNGDILTKEYDRMIDILGGIKQNTKRRQYQEVRT